LAFDSLLKCDMRELAPFLAMGKEPGLFHDRGHCLSSLSFPHLSANVAQCFLPRSIAGAYNYTLPMAIKFFLSLPVPDASPAVDVFVAQ